MLGRVNPLLRQSPLIPQGRKKKTAFGAVDNPPPREHRRSRHRNHTATTPLQLAYTSCRHLVGDRHPYGDDRLLRLESVRCRRTTGRGLGLGDAQFGPRLTCSCPLVSSSSSSSPPAFARLHLVCAISVVPSFPVFAGSFASLGVRSIHSHHRFKLRSLSHPALRCRPSRFEFALAAPLAL